MSRDLLMFGEDWGGLPSSTQHLAKALLAGGDRILWVNSLGLRRPRLTDGRRLLTKLAAATRARSPAPVSTGPRPHRILAPVAPPVPRPGFERAVAGRWLARQIRRALLESNLAARPILWTSLPTATPVLDHLSVSATVYYCCDDFSALEGVDHAAVTAYEEELAHRADLILVSSPDLAAKFPNAKTRVVLHGADTEMFGTPQPCPVDVPTDRPTVGFYGSLAGWIDWDWLGALARLLPDWEVQLIGPTKPESAQALARLAKLPNVRLLGPRPHAALPAYVQAWTAALLPFRDTAQIQACNPLKLREYLSAGTPCIATDFPAARAYSPEAHIARSVTDAAAYLRGLQNLPADQAARAAQARQHRVAGESWAARAATIRAYLDALQ